MNKFDKEIQTIATRNSVHGRVPDFEKKLFDVDLTSQKVYDAYISLFSNDTTKNEGHTVYLASIMKEMEKS